MKDGRCPGGHCGAPAAGAPLVEGSSPRASLPNGTNRASLHKIAPYHSHCEDMHSVDWVVRRRLPRTGIRLPV
jgi:hypothetical protein